MKKAHSKQSNSKDELIAYHRVSGKASMKPVKPPSNHLLVPLDSSNTAFSSKSANFIDPKMKTTKIRKDTQARNMLKFQNALRPYIDMATDGTYMISQYKSSKYLGSPVKVVIISPMQIAEADT